MSHLFCYWGDPVVDINDGFEAGKPLIIAVIRNHCLLPIPFLDFFPYLFQNLPLVLLLWDLIDIYSHLGCKIWPIGGWRMVQKLRFLDWKMTNQVFLTKIEFHPNWASLYEKFVKIDEIVECFWCCEELGEHFLMAPPIISSSVCQFLETVPSPPGTIWRKIFTLEKEIKNPKKFRIRCYFNKKKGGSKSCSATSSEEVVK